MVWYSHLLMNFPQFVVIYTVEDFGVINKAEVDVFLVFSSFFDDPVDVGSLICGSPPFLIQLEHLKIHSSSTVEAWLGEF